MPDIIRCPSEAAQEGEKTVGRLVPSRIARSRRCHRKCLLLHGERRLDIDLGGFGPFMAEPESDDRPVDTDLHEIHRRGVAQHVYGYPLAGQ